MIRTRTVTDRDGNPIEIEIDDATPDERLTLDEIAQLIRLAKAIIKGGVPAPFELPPYEHKYKRKKKSKDLHN